MTPSLQNPSADPRPIGLFDSGVGGLTVWREVTWRLPNEDLVYFADQAHCPYGSRSPAEVCARAQAATTFLLQHGAKLVVVACNTASAAALEALRASFPDIPFVGMEPAIKPAAAHSRTRQVGVLATRGTLAGDLFVRTRARVAGDGLDIVVQTGDGLVERVEAGDVDSPETAALLRQYLQPLCAQGVDRIVLGCTHYPFLAPLIQSIVGDEVELIDPSPAVARQVERVLEAHTFRNAATHRAAYSFFTSGDPAAFARAIDKLLHRRDTVERAAV